MKFLNYGNVGQVAEGFGTMTPEQEFFQPVAADAHFEALETQYFGFNIPEHDLNGEIYIWHHPVLKSTSGGFTCWRGHKKRQISADYQDYRWFMPMPDSSADYTLPNGVSIKFIEPLKSVEISFTDEARDTHLTLRMDAIMPPAVRKNGGHFTQAMRTKGKLRLLGEDMEIDGFYTRDHSWGEFRTEAPLPIPPLTWIAGTFDENFAFHLAAFDSAELHPEWDGLYEGPGVDENMRWGYVWKDGRLRNIIRCKKLTHRMDDKVLVSGIDMEFEDSEGEIYTIKGTSTASYPWMSWSNMHCAYALAKWECNGLTGWGEIQDCIWNDHMKWIEAQG